MDKHPLSGARRRFPHAWYCVERRTFWLFGPKQYGFVILYEDGVESRPAGWLNDPWELREAADAALRDAQARYLADMERR